MTTPTSAEVRVIVSHAWQWAVVVASAAVGIEHIAGTLLPNWDPSLSLRELPWFISVALGLMMLFGSVLTAQATRERLDPYRRWRREYAGLGLLALTWAAQTICTVAVSPLLMVSWTAYLAIAAGCWARLRQSKCEREAAYLAAEEMEKRMGDDGPVA